ncbi:MAG: hypothetical protein ACLR6J_04255 [Parabacteroides merdae]
MKVQCQAQLELSEACGKLVKREYCHEVNDDELRKDVHEKCYAKAYAVATSGTDKHQRAEAFEAVVEEYKAQFSEEELTDEKVEMIGRYYHDVEKEAMRRAILDEGKRLDGRKTTEIRSDLDRNRLPARSSWFCNLHAWRNTVAFDCYLRYKSR